MKLLLLLLVASSARCSVDESFLNQTTTTPSIDREGRFFGFGGGRREKSAIIFIHGLGVSLSTACKLFFGPAMGLSRSRNYVRCPVAPSHATTIFPPTFLPGSRRIFKSWFNFRLMPVMSIYSPVPGEEREHLDSSLKIIEAEIEDLISLGVPSENIVVSGASQGGVMTIWTALYTKYKLGGFIPIVTWLPLRKVNDITQIHPPPVNADTPILHLNGLLDPIVPLPCGHATKSEMTKVFSNYELSNRPGTHATTMGPQNIPKVIRWLAANTNIQFSRLNLLAKLG